MSVNSTDALVAPLAADAAEYGLVQGFCPATWQVSIRNLTPPGSQPLSPPAIAVHRPDVHVWQEGQIASHALVAVAEDANIPILVSALRKLPGVVEAFAVEGAPSRPDRRGSTRSGSGPVSGSASSRCW